MQVSVETAGAIERKLTVSIPRAEVDRAIEKRLREVGRNARVPGFRPGKTPHTIIAKRYGEQVTDEVISDTINASYREALGREGLQPAGLLSLEPKPFVAGDDLQYVATVELFPHIPAPTLAGRTLEKPVCEVTEADVDAALEKFRKRFTEFVARGPGEGAQDGDRLTVDSEVHAEGKKLADGAGRDTQFVLGQRTMLAQLEDGLLGATVGETRRITLDLPADYSFAEAAGKTLELEVTVKAVERAVLPDLDDAFVAELGLHADMAQMRADAKFGLEREAKARINSLLRRRVFDALLAANPIDTPRSMVEAEIDDRLQTLSEARGARDGELPEDDEAREQLRPAAARHVALGLIARAIIDNENLKVEAAAVRDYIAGQAALEADEKKSKALLDWYYAEPARARQVESMLLEEQTVARMLETATVVEKPLSFEELTQIAGR